MSRAGALAPVRDRLRREVRARSGPLRMLPTVLIIGAQKGGTTSLHHWLVQHPEIGEPIRKEVHYFDLNSSEPESWYRLHFPLRGRYPHTIDSSPYYLFHPAAPARAHALLPDVKLIAVLRHPVKRAYSQYFHTFRRGDETLSFQDALAAEETRLAGEAERLIADPRARSRAHRRQSYASRSTYTPQLRRWLEFFSPEQMLILRSEDLFADPVAVLGRVHAWLGVAPHRPSEMAPRLRRSYDPIDPGVEADLTRRFAVLQPELEHVSGVSFDWF